MLRPFHQRSLPNLTRWLVVVILPQAIFQSYVLGQADYNLSPVCFHASNNLFIRSNTQSWNYESRLCFTKIFFWYNLYWLFLTILILKRKSVWYRSKETANFVKKSGFLDSIQDWVFDLILTSLTNITDKSELNLFRKVPIMWSSCITRLKNF